MTDANGQTILIRPSKPEAGYLVVEAHGDKAIAQRATILAAMADGVSTLRGVPQNDDTGANIRILHDLGIDVAERPERPGQLEMVGQDFRELAVIDRVLDAGNSATSSRIFVSVLAGSRSRVVVDGNASLRSRSMSEVAYPLNQVGARLRYLGEHGRLPIAVEGRPLPGGFCKVTVDSAQPVSALLFAATLADDRTVIERQTAARDHTERLLRWTGIDVEESEKLLSIRPARPRSFALEIPGDPSHASLLAALHLAAGSHASLTIRGVGLNPRRRGFLTILENLGVEIHAEITDSRGPEPVGDIVVGLPRPLGAGTVEGKELVQSAIDELPLLAALAVHGEGPLVIRDAFEMRGKDTDRITELVRLINAFGGDASERYDGLEIRPKRLSPPEHVALPRDHRIVFAAFVLALQCGTTISLGGVDAMSTSNPRALEDLGRFAVVSVR